MLDLLQITNDPLLARRCDALEGLRLFVDLEHLGKAQRQAGRNTFISHHTLDDVARIKDVLQRSALMVRVNPWHADTAREVEAVIERGADLLMLPMFETPAQIRAFAELVAGRCRVVALVETPGALHSLSQWVDTPGVWEVFVGLNDLHLALGSRFMFEPLASGMVDEAARLTHARGLRFGFGGIAQMDQGTLPGRDVLAEHMRVGSQAVILSRTFAQGPLGLEAAVGQLRELESQLAQRSPAQLAQDQQRITALIHSLAAA